MVNDVTLLGNLGKDPETRAVGTAKVCRLALATSVKYKNNQGELVEETTWHDIECWDKLAEYAQEYLSKGSKVFIKGSIKSQSWEDDKGVKHYRTFVRAFRLLGLSPRPSNYTPPTQEDFAPEETDDMPF